MSATEIQAYTAGEAAKELNVTVPMVYRWMDEGKLVEMKLARGRVRLATAESVEALKKQRDAA